MPSPIHTSAQAHDEGRTRASEDGRSSLLVERLVPEAVAVCCSFPSKDRLLTALASLMAGSSTRSSATGAEAIEHELREREAAQSTALGHGVAIPHATVEGLPRTIVGVMTLDPPVAFGDEGDDLVDVCFCLLGPPSDRPSHLRLLAAIAGAVMDDALLSRMREASTAEALLDVLRAARAPG